MRTFSGTRRASFSCAQEVYRILLSSLGPVTFSCRKRIPLHPHGLPHDVSRMEYHTGDITVAQGNTSTLSRAGGVGNRNHPTVRHVEEGRSSEGITSTGMFLRGWARGSGPGCRPQVWAVSQLVEGLGFAPRGQSTAVSMLSCLVL